MYKRIQTQAGTSSNNMKKYIINSNRPPHLEQEPSNHMEKDPLQLSSTGEEPVPSN
jgi:hypothetical protein